MQAEAGAPLNAAAAPSAGRDETSSDSGADATPEEKPSRSNRLIGVLIGIAVVTYAIDQLSKAWVVANLQMGEPHPIVGDFFQLRRAANPGAAFSIATNATWLLTIIAIVVIGCTIWAARKLRSRGWAAALGLLIGGALGNLTDRFFRAPGGGKGHVVDMFQLPNWPIFNVADVWIVSAAVLICLLAFRGIGIDGTRVSDDKDGDDKDRDGKARDEKARDEKARDGEGEAGAAAADGVRTDDAER